METINFILVITLIVGTFALIIWYAKKRKRDKALADLIKDLPIDPAKLVHSAVTELGIGVRSVNPVNNVTLECIDAGFLRINNIVRTNPYNYTNGIYINDFTVWVLPNSPRASSDMPSFERPAGAYAGTEYDQGGYILAAGEFLPNINPFPIVIAEATENSRSYSVNAVSYELEHLYAYLNDRPLYETTKYHTSSTSHPIYPENI